MTRGLATIAVILVLAIGAAWSVARLRERVPAPGLRPNLPESSPAEISEAVAVLDGSPAYRGALAPPVIRSARAISERTVEVLLDPRDLARAKPEMRAHPSLLGLLPTVAQGRIERIDPAVVEESWRLACPDGCALDLFDRDPPAGSPGGAWSVRPPTSRAVAWFAFDAERLADPQLGGAGLAPLRQRIEAVEKLLNRPIRSDLAAGLAGTGIAALEEREPGRAPRLLVALDLARADRARRVVDLLVSLAVVAGRGEIRRHREVALGVIGTPPRAAAVAIDGSLLLLSDEAAAVTAAIDRRRATGIPAGPPPSFAGFHGSWRAERTVPSTVTATLQRDGVAWWLKGRGASPAVTADPLLTSVRALLAAR